MQRLLMGEVGSGKTVVALYAMLRAIEAGHQAALMAPTETLAEQHFRDPRVACSPREPVPVDAAHLGDAAGRAAASCSAAGRRASRSSSSAPTP